MTGYLNRAWKYVFVHNQFSPVSKSAILNLPPTFPHVPILYLLPLSFLVSYFID